MIPAKAFIAIASLLFVNEATSFLQYSVVPHQSGERVSLGHHPARVYSSKFPSTTEQDNRLFEEFLIDRKKRELIYNTPLTQNLDSIDQEYLIQRLTTHTFQNGEFVVRQGQEGSEMYFTEEGNLMATKELPNGDLEKLMSYDQPHQLLGEMSFLTGQARAASILVTSDSATLFCLSKDDFERVMSRSEAMNLLKENTPYVEEYVELCTKKKLLQNCPVFADLSEGDLERVASHLELQSVDEGSQLISQGDSGDAMYFVEQGKFRFDIDGKTIDAECGEGRFFGELALFLDQPRAADVTSLTEASVWVLKRDDFLDAIDDSAIDKKALELLLEKYRSTSAKTGRLGIALQLRPGDLREIMVHKSRPKKRSVSFHAIFCLFALGSFVSSLMGVFAPGIDSLGLPRIFNVNGFNELSLLRQFQISSWLMTVSGLMGLLRIPKKAPQSRKLLFEAAGLYNLFVSFYVTSNLSGTHAALFNAFQFPGNLLVTVPGFYAWFHNLVLIDDAVAGPMNGRHTIPLAGTRRSSIIAMVLMTVTSILFIPLQLPVFFSDLASYERNVSSFIQAGSQGQQLSSIVCTQAGVWLSSFFATLLYEGKMKSSSASLWCGAVLFFCLFDAVMLALAGLFSPTKVLGGENMLLYFNTIVRNCAMNKIAFGLIAATILNAVRKTLRPRKEPV